MNAILDEKKKKILPEHSTISPFLLRGKKTLAWIMKRSLETILHIFSLSQRSRRYTCMFSLARRRIRKGISFPGDNATTTVLDDRIPRWTEGQGELQLLRRHMKRRG